MTPQSDAPGRPSGQRIGSRPDLRVLVAVEEGEAVKLIKDDTDKGLHKDTKEKEGKDTEEKKVKEGKDPGKDSKEKDVKESKEKEHKDREKTHEEQAKAPESTDAGAGWVKNVADRLTGLEEAVVRLTHFIGPELRPDLSVSALSNEQADLTATPGRDPQPGTGGSTGAKDVVEVTRV